MACKYLARYMIAVLGSVAMAIVYGLKVNLSIAIVKMVKHGNDSGAKMCPSPTESSSSSDDSSSSSASEDNDKGFPWTDTQKGMVLSCYFWGYLISLFPGAYIAERCSSKWTMFFSVGINIVCTLLTPEGAKLHLAALITLRVLEGIGGGVTFPAMHCMIGKWAPPTERSTISTIVYSGTSYGAGLSIIISGLLLSNWENIFYVMGALSCLWLVLWVILAADKPETAKVISSSERDYIVSSLGASSAEKVPPLPARSVFTSPPFWGIFVAHTFGNWGWYLLILCMPLYFYDYFHQYVKDKGYIYGMPFFILIFFIIGMGKLFDILVEKEKLTLTWARKIATIISTLGPSICLALLIFFDCRDINLTIAMIITGVAIVLCGAMFVGYLTNHIDIAPLYAGTLVAITNTMGTMSGIVVPVFIGVMTNNKKGNDLRDAWRIVFGVTIILFLVGAIMFVILGTAVEQPWSKG